MSPAAAAPRPAEARDPQAPAFRHRGIVEGFYGTPWSHEDRLWWIDRLGAWGLNRYVHAPKDDPLHRQRWREPYPLPALHQFEALVRRGHDRGVAVGFAISPGLSIRYGSREDRKALCEKLHAFHAVGARFLTLALDDVPSELAHAQDRSAFPSLAAAHVTLAHEVREAVARDGTLWLVPTDYLGTEPTDYLEELGASLHPEIEVGWTGRTVLSPTIRADEIRARSATLGRPLLLWDNTPVADGPMRPMLHLNPYRGRDAALADHASGVLLNPMAHPRASALTVHTAAHFLAEPQRYDPEQAFEEAAAALGEGAPEAFALFARAHRFSPLSPDDRDVELEGALVALREALERDVAPATHRAIAELRKALDRRAAVAPALHEHLADRRLAAEIAPWIDAHARETRCMRAALDCIARICEADTAKDRVFAFFALEARLSREPQPPVASYGPRRVLYPQLASMRDDAMALADDPTLLTGRCLADAFLETAEALALERLRHPPAASPR